MKDQFPQPIRRHVVGGVDFLISIHYQENNSWQGTIQWLNTGEVLHFRSELEMMNLMTQAAQKMNPSGENLRTWDGYTKDQVI